MENSKKIIYSVAINALAVLAYQFSIGQASAGSLITDLQNP
jgi:hypothetical protein